MTRSSGALILAMTWAIPERASAQSVSASSARTWYGWQTLIADGIAVGFAGPPMVRASIDAATLDSGLVSSLEIGVAFYLLGTPIVHVVHGHIGRGLGSLGLRILLPAVGSIAFGAGGCPKNSDVPCLASGKGANLGALIGGLVAIGIDALRAEDEPEGTLALVPIAAGRGLALAKRF